MVLSWYDERDGQRVVRGGSWVNGPVDLRVSTRGGGTSVNRDTYLGFRLVQDLP
jgi:formylglycine-generating enzyme required for sulfatase activity